MKPSIKYLLTTDNKDWNQANNDILLLSIIIEMHDHFQKINDSFYKSMLNEELYNIRLDDKEYLEILEYLMEMVKQYSSFSSTIVGVLAESENENVNNFLLLELEHKYLVNPDLACCIIKGLSGMRIGPSNQLLAEISQKSSDNELKELALNRLQSILINKDQV